jgi:hypothetical protein
VKTENPSACNGELESMQISYSAVLPVVSSCMNKVSINSIIQSKTSSYTSHNNPLNRDNTIDVYLNISSVSVMPKSNSYCYAARLIIMGKGNLS